MAHGSSKSKNKQRDRRSGSRNTTPLSTTSAVELPHNPYIQTPINQASAVSDTQTEDIINTSGAQATPPGAKDLKAIADSVAKMLLDPIRQRGDRSNELIRELRVKEKEREQRERIREQEAREAEERRIKTKKVTPKKREREEEHRPPAIGAHGLARQDGEMVKADDSSSISSPASQPPPSLPDTSVKADKAGSPSSTASPQQPPPAPSVQQYQVFGEDPSKYPDPTIYHIRDITPDIEEDEKKAILSVAQYPPSDLHDLTCGTPPDRDYSQPKPAQQVTFQTFLNYVEPYIRNLTEEDRAFLLERGDREKPFIVPKLGAKHYKELWAEEDTGMTIDTEIKMPDNEPRGSIEQMNDDVAESEEISTGPLMSRLLTMLRPGRSSASNADTQENGVNGIDGEMEIDGEENNRDANKAEPQPPATQMPDWKNAPPMPKTDYGIMDDRIRQELVHLGFLAPNEQPDYNSSMDDEVMARLRYLQGELRSQSILNGARKQRILELTEEHMAAQEWSTIQEDLDSQLNQAYLKRNRNIGKKGSKLKRPGGPGGGSHPVGVARSQSLAQGVGEPIRSLMDRKEKWTSWIGPVVNYGKMGIPEESIFDEKVMERLIAKEQEEWGDIEEA